VTALDEIMAALAQRVTEGAARLSKNALVAARFSDGLWYRARILTVDPLTVHYVDYGNVR
jgi:hypothetical protein